MSWTDKIFGTWFNNKSALSGFFSVWNTSPQFNSYAEDIEKLQVVLNNPAMLKVFSLCCDLFSLGEVYVYQNGKSVDEDPFLTFISDPNKRQQKEQFLWDFCFWNMMGNAYLYLDSAVIDRTNNTAQFLEPYKIDWPISLDNKKDKIILSIASENELMSTVMSYEYSDGTNFKFPLKKLICIPDLTNGTGNWFKGPSRIDSLKKVINNSEEAMDSKNVNLRFSAKYMVAGTSKADDVTKVPLSQVEKLDIEKKSMSKDPVTALKSLAEIKRFVENIANLKLDESYLSDYFVIGTEYGIPKDVLEAFNSGTFENQEKARGAVVSYSLQPRANKLMNALKKAFGTVGKSYVMSWDHLSFMQVFEKERADTAKVKADTLLILLKCGIKLEEINAILDTNFTDADYEAAKQQNTGNSGQAQGDGATN